GEVGSGNALPPLPSPATALPNFGQCRTTKSIFQKKSDFAQIIIDSICLFLDRLHVSFFYEGE
ncbi:MAG: hypothetical protein IKJ58_04510, partial [Akkermansia sp.]|nr:hypothetical protein [Akkermansia sp.]